jgi:putative salt-induced outer membrane protein YdiY
MAPFLALAAAAAPAGAATVPGWYSSTDLSFAMQRGNSETMNLGVNTDLTRQWLRTAWRNNGSFVRTTANEPNRLAIGTTPANAVLQTGPSVTKSEKLFFNSDLERRVTERFFWNVAASVERDPFAGLKYRTLGAVGIGYLWQSTDGTGLFRVGVAGTYTKQVEVVDDPDTLDEFAGARFTADGEKRFGDQKQHQFTSKLIVDESVQDTDDLRFNWQNGLTASMNRRLALKLGVQLSYDNQPQLVEFPVVQPNGAETNFKVNGRADKLDTQATVSVVISFQPGK